MQKALLNMAQHYTQMDNDCIIWLDKKEIDTDTMMQISNMCKHPSTKHVRVMPDCHAGNGCCIGFTSELTQVVSPHIIGGDIGCGVTAYKIPNEYTQKKKFYEKINQSIINNVNMGKYINNMPIIAESQLDSFFETTQRNAQLFVEEYKKKFNIDISTYIPTYNLNWLKDRCNVIGLNYVKMLCCVGTIGGSNHFIEVDSDDSDNCLLVVHSGSRLFGKAIYDFWASFMNEQKTNGKCDDNDDEDEEPHAFDNSYVLTGEKSYLYFADMLFAQQFAVMNRIAAISLVLNDMHIPFDATNMITSTHNYIDFSDLIIRKGAIKAYKNEQCIVALNMRDGILIGYGMSNPEWNYSAPHGCGRTMARSTALKALLCKTSEKTRALQKFKEEMKDVISSTITLDILAERPSVYRNCQIIKDSITNNTLENIVQYKTMVVAKGK